MSTPLVETFYDPNGALNGAPLNVTPINGAADVIVYQLTPLIRPFGWAWLTDLDDAADTYCVPPDQRCHIIPSRPDPADLARRIGC